MNARPVLYLMLAVVAVAAAVLSFAALRDLALLCGFSARLAWLLPVTVDAGAAAGTLAWLGGHGAARGFGRALALILLGSSVAGNAVGHGLTAYAARPHWLLVVAVSAVAPAVLGAVVHLAVLAGRPAAAPEPSAAEDDPDGDPYAAALLELDERGLSRRWETAPAADPPGVEVDRAAGLIAAGAGRRTLARELDITEHEARQLLARARPAAPQSGRASGDRAEVTG